MDTWQKVLHKVEEKVGPQHFNTWFKPTQLLYHEGNALYVRVPNKFIQEWLYERMDIVVQAAEDAGFGEITVVYLIEKGDPPEQRNLDFESVENTLNPAYTFDSFVIGGSNQFAHAAARAVAENPAKAYNPLFLYGGVGLGKTHLMHAIGHEIKRRNRSLRLTYISSETFTNEMINAIRYDRILSFREKYRNNDVLLIDDIQFIAQKERTQEEFFHTFNALYDGHKQIVISADCRPKEIPTLEEWLHSRFEWGLIADLQPPDLETKIAIIRKKAEQHGIPLPDNVALFIATSIKSNIRELEGAMIRLVAFASMREADISLSLAQETLREILHTQEKAVTIEMIQKTIADYYGMRVQDLKSKNNSAAVALPRQVAMYICKKVTTYSLPYIGREFGNKHHTTVLHSIQKIEGLRRSDPELNRLISTLTDSLR